MQRYGRGAGRGAGRGGLGGEGDERDGGLRGAAAAAVGSGGFPSSPLPGGVVHSAGAPVHIPAAGGSKPVLQCRVLLLDGTEVNVELPVSSVRLPPPPAKRRLRLPSPLLRIVPPSLATGTCECPPPAAQQAPFAGKASLVSSFPPRAPSPPSPPACTCCQVRGAPPRHDRRPPPSSLPEPSAPFFPLPGASGEPTTRSPPPLRSREQPLASAAFRGASPSGRGRPRGAGATCAFRRLLRGAEPARRHRRPWGASRYAGRGQRSLCGQRCPWSRCRAADSPQPRAPVAPRGEPGAAALPPPRSPGVVASCFSLVRVSHRPRCRDRPKGPPGCPRRSSPSRGARVRGRGQG